jgi:hypothetical protein
MFERGFQWALKHGSRFLFCAAGIILLAGILQAIDNVASGIRPGGTTYAGRLGDALARNWRIGLPFLVGGLSTASIPFFCALVIQRIDRWMQRDRTVAAPASNPAPGWLARSGAHLLFLLSLLYFLSAALNLIDWAQNIVSLHQIVFFQGAWLAPLSTGGLLLFASLALDRLDRWLATIRPYSG